MADKKKGGEKPKKEGMKLSALYEISGDSISRKNKNCPKCGPGVFLGKHKDRENCGNCGYTEYMSKAPAEPATEEAPVEA